MNFTLRIVLLLVSLFFLAFVLYRVRKGRYMLKYSLVWILLSVVGVISSLFPHVISFLSVWLGFNVPSNFVYFALIVFLMVWNLVLCGVLSRQETTIKSLVQEVSMLKSSIRLNAAEAETGADAADLGESGK